MKKNIHIYLLTIDMNDTNLLSFTMIWTNGYRIDASTFRLMQSDYIVKCPDRKQSLTIIPLIQQYQNQNLTEKNRTYQMH